MRPNSRKGWYPARRLIAPETPCGSSNHQGIIFRFHALTITSTSWSSRSPSTIRDAELEQKLRGIPADLTGFLIVVGLRFQSVDLIWAKPDAPRSNKFSPGPAGPVLYRSWIRGRSLAAFRGLPRVGKVIRGYCIRSDGASVAIRRIINFRSLKSTQRDIVPHLRGSESDDDRRTSNHAACRRIPDERSMRRVRRARRLSDRGTRVVRGMPDRGWKRVRRRSRAEGSSGVLGNSG